MRPGILPYGRQMVDQADIDAVVEVLRSDWLTTGPVVERFERAFALRVDADYAMAVSSGTAGLHLAVLASGIGPGDEVILPPMTFAATANAVLYAGGKPVFADVDPDTLLLDPTDVELKVTSRTKAIIGVDYAGQPCDWTSINEIARRHNLVTIADACHAVGAMLAQKRVGSIADLSVFSFHPVKHIATGEGGMITTSDSALASRIRILRNHGISSDFRQRAERGTVQYEMVELGFNYRLTDIQCALGLSQLQKLDDNLKARRSLADSYALAFQRNHKVVPLSVRADVQHAFHLYVVRLDMGGASVDRNGFVTALRAEGIGANVHYIPVHFHPYYRSKLGMSPGLCPVAEAAYEKIVTLPLWPGMSQGDAQDVIAAVNKVMDAYTGNSGEP